MPISKREKAQIRTLPNNRYRPRLRSRSMIVVQLRGGRGMGEACKPSHHRLSYENSFELPPA